MRAQIEFIALINRSIFVGSIVLVLVARGIRAVLARRRGIVHGTYPDGKAVYVAPGTTILEASKTNDIPHASVCGGRGRCSTCRVRLVVGEDALPAISAEEQKILDRISAPRHVRLACQTSPTTDFTVMPLLPPTATPKDGHQRAAHHMGQEREIVILFADLRDFTKFSEQILPYDVVFVLNRYFAFMGGAVGEAGGRLDKLIGDAVIWCRCFNLYSRPTSDDSCKTYDSPSGKIESDARRRTCRTTENWHWASCRSGHYW
jgi:adenylate cyclase